MLSKWRYGRITYHESDAVAIDKSLFSDKRTGGRKAHLFELGVVGKCFPYNEVERRLRQVNTFERGARESQNAYTFQCSRERQCFEGGAILKRITLYHPQIRRQLHTRQNGTAIAQACCQHRHTVGKDDRFQPL